MSYKISIKTDGDFFTVDCCEFEHFADAKTRVRKMIVDLMFWNSNPSTYGMNRI